LSERRFTEMVDAFRLVVGEGLVEVGVEAGSLVP
jgi:hypothetical protein